MINFILTVWLGETAVGAISYDDAQQRSPFINPTGKERAFAYGRQLEFEVTRASAEGLLEDLDACAHDYASSPSWRAACRRALVSVKKQLTQQGLSVWQSHPKGAESWAGAWHVESRFR